MLQTNAQRDEEKVGDERRQAIAQQFDANRDQAQLQAATARWQAHDVVGCRRQLSELLARRPNHPQARLLWAELLLTEGNLKEGLAAIESLVQDNPEDAAAQHLLGLALESQGQAHRAVSHYREAARLGPDNPIYCSTYETALASAEPSRVIPTAESTFGEALSVHGSKRGAASTKNVRIISASPDGAEADQSRVVHASAVEAPSSGLAAAEQAFIAGDLAKARQHLSAYADAGDAQAAVTAGLLALRCGQPRVATELLTSAQAAYPSSASVARTLGTARYRDGDYPAARQAFEAAVALDNSHGLSYFLLGCTLSRLGQDELARARFAEARRLDPRLAAEPALEPSR